MSAREGTGDTGPRVASPEADEGPLDTATAMRDFQAGRLLFRGLVGIALLFVGAAVALYFAKAEVVAWSEAFVDVAGGPGVMAAWYVLDVIPLPLIPHDVFMGVGYLGGIGFCESVAWCSVGSLCGGFTSWYLSSRLAHKPAVYRLITTGKARRIFDLVRKYGAIALAVGAVSPLPYGMAAWACGATDLRPGTFALVSLLRIPRIAFYLWLFKLGVVDFLS